MDVRASVFIAIGAAVFQVIFCQRCPFDQFKCFNGRACIHRYKLCDGRNDCPDGTDEYPEYPCSTTTVKPVITTPEPPIARDRVTQWFEKQRRDSLGVDRWGDQLHRTAVALSLGGYNMNNHYGKEMAYELTIRLLSNLATCREGAMPSEDLALYINALQVCCLDPQDFYGHNLVSELRTRVESANHTNPFDVLVLCTAGDTMTTKDLDRVTQAHDSQHRPFWMENQAIATMAVACLSTRSDVIVDERTLRDMANDLKKRQFRNGTVDNLRTTALTLQALTAAKSTDSDFNRSAAIGSLESVQRQDGSFGSLFESYYVLPALNGKSLADVSSSHCKRTTPTAEETLGSLLKWSDSRFHVQYSVWIRKDVVLGRTWRIMVKPNVTVYDVIETVNRLDKGHNVVYSVYEGKPYVSGLSGIPDDPETGVYWFVFLRKKDSQEDPVLKEESPVDLTLRPNQEIILWYRSAEWKDDGK